METITDIFVRDINAAFPNRFTIDESSITYHIEHCYSATITSNVPLYCGNQTRSFGSASCEVIGNKIYIQSGVMNDILRLLLLIK